SLVQHAPLRTLPVDTCVEDQRDEVLPLRRQVQLVVEVRSVEVANAVDFATLYGLLQRNERGPAGHDQHALTRDTLVYVAAERLVIEQLIGQRLLPAGGLARNRPRGLRPACAH